MLACDYTPSRVENAAWIASTYATVGVKMEAIQAFKQKSRLSAAILAGINTGTYAVFASVRMQLVHSILRTDRPFSITETFCKLGRKVRLVARMEKLRLLPKVVDFPHRSHFAIVRILSYAIIIAFDNGVYTRSRTNRDSTTIRNHFQASLFN
jgi:hypothetical protein